MILCLYASVINLQETNMPISIAHKVQKVKPSPTLSVAAKASALKAQGLDIINLSVGEPDFDTPEHIKNAAKKAMDEGFTKYTPVEGAPSLRQAIVNKFRHENQLTYKLSQIIVSVGAKHVIYNAMQAILNPGDEVIIPAPFWVSYPDMAILADARPVYIETGSAHHFKITPKQLSDAITVKTRLLILNSPSNPSGMAYTSDELSALGEVLDKHPEIVILTDDIYEHLLWNGEFVNIVNTCPELYDRTIVVNGVSKSYAMTGWRIGYAGGPENVIQAMIKIQSQSTSNPDSIAQMASKAALEGNQDFIPSMKTIFKSRHDIVVAELNKIPGIHCLPVDGTFYVFPDVSQAIKSLGLKDDIEFAEFLINKANVATVPGTAFGTPGHIRISFASSEELLRKAIDRIRTALS